MSPVELPIHLASVAAARRLLAEHLDLHWATACRTDGEARERARDAVLMTSELVTNALRRADRLLLLEIKVREDGTLYVGVVDDAPGGPFIPARETYAPGGRGIAIVEALADSWGITPGPGNKTVWFEVHLP